LIPADMHTPLQNQSERPEPTRSTERLTEIDRRTANWPKDARTKWGFLLAAVRPRNRGQRGFICAAIGGAVMAVAAVAWKFFS
jgi:hypothetical protein